MPIVSSKEKLSGPIWSGIQNWQGTLEVNESCQCITCRCYWKEKPTSNVENNPLCSVVQQHIRILSVNLKIWDNETSRLLAEPFKRFLTFFSWILMLRMLNWTEYVPCTRAPFALSFNVAINACHWLSYVILFSMQLSHDCCFCQIDKYRPTAICYFFSKKLNKTWRKLWERKRSEERVPRERERSCRKSKKSSRKFVFFHISIRNNENTSVVCCSTRCAANSLNQLFLIQKDNCSAVFRIKFLQ